MKLLLRLAALSLAFPLGACAQLGVYGAFSTSTLSTISSTRLNGGLVGLQYDGSHHPLVNFGFDLRGSYVKSDSNHATVVSGGPRLVLHLPVVPLRAYGEALVGGGSVNFGQGSATTNTGTVTGGVAVGGDLHILPFIDWRVIDYNYTRLVQAHTGQNTFSTGIVIRIPFS